jgi:hypothetical protein
MRVTPGVENASFPAASIADLAAFGGIIALTQHTSRGIAVQFLVSG